MVTPRPVSLRPSPLVVFAVLLLGLWLTGTFLIVPDWEAIQRLTPARFDPLADRAVGPRTLALVAGPAAAFIGISVLDPLHRGASVLGARLIHATGRPLTAAVSLTGAMVVGVAAVAVFVHPAVAVLVLLPAFTGGAGTAAFVRALSGGLVAVPIGGLYLCFTGDRDALVAEFPLRSGRTESIPYLAIVIAVIFTVEVMRRYPPVPLGTPGSRLHRLTRPMPWVSLIIGALIGSVGVLALHDAMGSPSTSVPLPGGPGHALTVLAILAVPVLLLLALTYAVAADLDEAGTNWAGPNRWLAPLASARAVARVIVVVGPLAYGAWLGLLAPVEPASSQVRDRNDIAIGVRQEPPDPAAPDIAIPLALPATRADIPDAVYQALEATEDIGASAGSAHPGVPPISLVRAASQVIGSGSSGGSGIAAQVIKREIGRPIADLFASIYPPLGRGGTVLDKLLIEFPAAWTYQATSDVAPPGQDPMTVWLNNVDLGHNTRGIAAAAWKFYGVKVRDLTVAQAATLVALANGPSAFDPYVHPYELVERRDLVLYLMGAMGYLTADEVEAAQREYLAVAPEVYDPNEQDFAAEAFIDQAMTEGEAQGFVGASRTGRTYSTTMDQTDQVVLEESVSLAIDQAAPYGVNDAAAIVIDARTGEIRAWFGGVYYADGEDAIPDTVSAIPHEPGSAIKPFVYACALELGFLEPDGTVLDDATTGRRLGVADHDGLYWGEISWQMALSGSRNIPAAELVRQMTPAVFVDCLRDRFAVTTNLEPDVHGPRLGIGLAPMPLLELANAYAILAAGGRDLPVTSLNRVEDRMGEVVYEPDATAIRTIPCRTTSRIATALLPVGERLGLSGWSAKSGTTPQSSVIAGFNEDRVVVAWLGNSEPMTGNPGALIEKQVDGAANVVLTAFARDMEQTDMTPATGCGGFGGFGGFGADAITPSAVKMPFASLALSARSRSGRSTPRRRPDPHHPTQGRDATDRRHASARCHAGARSGSRPRAR